MADPKAEVSIIGRLVMPVSEHPGGDWQIVFGLTPSGLLINSRDFQNNWLGWNLWKRNRHGLV